MNNYVWALLAYLILNGCSSNHSQQNVENPELLLTSSNFQTSILYALKNGRMTEIATGLSADPILLGLKDQIFIFNRKDTDLNFNRVSLTGSRAIQLQNQTNSAPLMPGDPTSAAELPNHDLLLTGYTSGKIFKLNPALSKIEEIDLKFDTGSGPFRPFDIYVTSKNDQTKIFILHHGLDESFKPNGREMLFIASWNGTSLAPIDMDPNLEGNQGIKVKSTSPQFLFKNQNEPLIVGLCDSIGINKKCAIERFNSESLSLSEVSNLSEFYGTSANAVTEGFDLHSIFFMREISANEIAITNFDFSGQSKVIFTLKNEGFQAFIKSDLTRGKLYGGANNALLEFQGDVLLKRHPLLYSPYNGYTVE